jgi:hypothetical protein
MYDCRDKFDNFEVITQSPYLQNFLIEPLNFDNLVPTLIIQRGRGKQCTVSIAARKIPIKPHSVEHAGNASKLRKSLPDGLPYLRIPIKLASPPPPFRLSNTGLERRLNFP